MLYRYLFKAFDFIHLFIVYEHFTSNFSAMPRTSNMNLQIFVCVSNKSSPQGGGAVSSCRQAWHQNGGKGSLKYIEQISKTFNFQKFLIRYLSR